MLFRGTSNKLILMNKALLYTRKSSGFTIIELLVVVVIIGILASLSVFAFGAWRSRVAEAEIKNDLHGVYAAMQSAKNWSNGYTVVPSDAVFNGTNNDTRSIFTQSQNNTLTYRYGDTAGYCIDAVSTAVSTVRKYMRVDATTKEPVIADGDCVGTLPTPVLAVARVSTSELDLSWAAISGASSYTITRSTASNMSSPVTVTTTGSSPFRDSGLNPSTRYYYRVKANNSQLSNIANALTFVRWNITKNTANTTTTCTAGSCTKTFFPEMYMLNSETTLIEGETGKGIYVAISNMDCSGTGCGSGTITLTLSAAGSVEMYDQLTSTWTSTIARTVSIPSGSASSYLIMISIRSKGTSNLGQISLMRTTNNPNMSLSGGGQMLTFSY